MSVETANQSDSAFSRSSLMSAPGLADAIIAGMPGAFYMFDRQGRFLSWNDNLLAGTGYSAEELASLHPLDLCASDCRAAVESAIQEVFSTGQGAIEASILTRQGQRVPHYLTGKRVVVQGRECLVGVGIDLTERYQAERKLRENEERLRKQNRVLLELTRGDVLYGSGLSASLRRITEAAAHTMQVERVGVWLFDGDRNEIRCADLYERAHNRHSEGLRLNASDHPRYFAALEADRTIAAHQARTDPRTSEFTEAYLAPLGITSMLDAPIRLGGHVAGVICHEHVGPPRQWAMDEQGFAASMADLVSLVLEGHDRRRREAESRQAQQAAEQASRLKSMFLANMSHEIRTPMNGILGMIELALGTNLSDEQRDYLEMARTSAHALLGVINDILDFSKIEADKLELEPAPFKLRECLHEIIGLHRVLASAKGLVLTCQVSDDVPDRLMGDAGRLRQILVNIIGNAIKFTEHGEVKVHVSATPREPDQVDLRFAVSDTGIGIPPDQQRLVFEPFVQADGSTTRKRGGTGLGLSIAARLTGMMGGRIWVESQEHQGSTFYFTATLGRLDQVADPSYARDHDGDDQAPAPTRPLRVLLVEDNPVSQRLAAGLLRKEGHKVVSAGNGREAVALFETTAGRGFDLVLMDVQLPVMSGFEATAAIREKEKAAGTRVPIIAMTACAMKGDQEQCLNAGMDDYIAKPIDARTLRRTLARWTRQEDTGEYGPSASDPQAAAPVPLQIDAALDRMQGDRQLLDEVLRVFLDQAPLAIEEIRGAIAGHDPRRLLIAAHGLKGSAANIAAEPTRQVAARLEALARAGQVHEVETIVAELETQVRSLCDFIHALETD